MAFFTNKQLGAVAVVGVLGAWYLKNKAVDVAKDVGEAINPVNRDNVFHTGASSLVNNVINDGEELPLGVRIYDWFHDE